MMNDLAADLARTAAAREGWTSEKTIGGLTALATDVLKAAARDGMDVAGVHGRMLAHLSDASYAQVHETVKMLVGGYSELHRFFRA